MHEPRNVQCRLKLDWHFNCECRELNNRQCDWCAGCECDQCETRNLVTKLLDAEIEFVVKKAAKMRRTGEEYTHEYENAKSYMRDLKKKNETICNIRKPEALRNLEKYEILLTRFGKNDFSRQLINKGCQKEQQLHAQLSFQYENNKLEIQNASQKIDTCKDKFAHFLDEYEQHISAMKELLALAEEAGIKKHLGTLKNELEWIEDGLCICRMTLPRNGLTD